MGEGEGVGGRKKKHISDLQHSGNMFIVFAVMENTRTQLKTIEYFSGGADQEHKM